MRGLVECGLSPDNAGRQPAVHGHLESSNALSRRVQSMCDDEMLVKAKQNEVESRVMQKTIEFTPRNLPLPLSAASASCTQLVEGGHRPDHCDRISLGNGSSQEGS